MQDQEPQYFTKFRVELHEKLDKRFDAHAEQIAYVSEEITVMKGEIKQINKTLDEHTNKFVEINKTLDEHTAQFSEINKRLDGHAEQIAHVSEQTTEIISTLNRKADTVYVDDINFRTKKLEKVAFA